MGCGSCNSLKSKTSGCKNSNSCSRCSRFSVFDWLSNINPSDNQKACSIIEVSFKNIVLSVQAIDKLGNVITVSKDKIKFGYRECDLNTNLIFLSASLKGNKKSQNLIKEKMILFSSKKETTQPTKIKTGGSTFKNPINQTDKKVWELVKSSVPLDTQFGDATISNKHANFFVNKDNASYKDMKQLIDFVKENVKKKTGINLDLEIILVE